MLRVQAWRKAHPGYGRKRGKKRVALQEDCPTQPLLAQEDKPSLNVDALQEVLSTQHLLLLGLISNLTDLRYKRTSTRPPSV